MVITKTNIICGYTGISLFIVIVISQILLSKVVEFETNKGNTYITDVSVTDKYHLKL